LFKIGYNVKNKTLRQTFPIVNFPFISSNIPASLVSVSVETWMLATDVSLYMLKGDNIIFEKHKYQRLIGTFEVKFACG
jgi:hypothetical protein